MFFTKRFVRKTGPAEKFLDERCFFLFLHFIKSGSRCLAQFRRSWSGWKHWRRCTISPRALPDRYKVWKKRKSQFKRNSTGPKRPRTSFKTRWSRIFKWRPKMQKNWPNGLKSCNEGRRMEYYRLPARSPLFCVFQKSDCTCTELLIRGASWKNYRGHVYKDNPEIGHIWRRF